MNKIAFVLLFAGAVSVSQTEAQIIREYGFKLAFTSADQQRDRGSFVAQTNRRNGINLAAYAEWLNLPFVSIITQIEYAQRGAGSPYFRIDAPGSFISYDRFDYLSVPLLLKVAIPGRAMTPYVCGGPRVDFLLGHKSDMDFYPNYYDNFKKSVLGVSAGCGVELTSLVPVALLIEARYNFDLADSYNTQDLTIRNNSVDLWLGIGF